MHSSALLFPFLVLCVFCFERLGSEGKNSEPWQVGATLGSWSWFRFDQISNLDFLMCWQLSSVHVHVADGVQPQNHTDHTILCHHSSIQQSALLWKFGENCLLCLKSHSCCCRSWPNVYFIMQSIDHGFSFQMQPLFPVDWSKMTINSGVSSCSDASQLLKPS